MSTEEDAKGARARTWAQLSLELNNARIRKLQQEEIERMNMPTNLGWFQGDTEPVEVHYVLKPTGEIVRLIDDGAPTPWPMRSIGDEQYRNGPNEEEAHDDETQGHETN